MTTPPAHADSGYKDPWGDNGNGTYTNPVLPADYSDPDPVRVGSDYYLAASTFTGSGGISILHSTDLVNWSTVGSAVPDISQLGSLGSRYNWSGMSEYGKGIYAPSIRYHNGTYVIVFAILNQGLFSSTATNPAGPWTVHQLIDKNGSKIQTSNWTDPSPYWDASGNGYLLVSHLDGAAQGNRGSFLFAMSADATQLLDADVTQSGTGTMGGTLVGAAVVGTEGNKIFFFNGYYYLQYIDFQGNSPNGAGAYIMRSPNLYGTRSDGSAGSAGSPGSYETKFLGNQVPTQGGFVQTAAGSWYFVGQFNDGSTSGGGGRQAHLVPVTWSANWPTIGSDPDADGVGSMVWTATKPVSGAATATPQGSDSFTSSTLSPQWQWNHQPRSGYWSLTDRPGYLRLKAFTPLTSGSFFTAGDTLFQRYMKANSVQAVTKMDISGMADGQQAGIANFNGGGSYTTLSVVQAGTARTWSYNYNGTVTAGPTVPSSTTSVYLASVISSGVNTFYYSYDGTTYAKLGSAASVAWWAGYRGNQVGIFTYNNASNTGYVDVDSFAYSYSGSGPSGTGFLDGNSFSLTSTTPKSIALMKNNGDGTKTNVSASATYVSADPDVATVSSSGAVTARSTGSTVITATYNGQAYLLSVTVSLSTPGLVLYFPFAEKSGTVAVDASGNGNDGTFVNSPTHVAGEYGSGLQLSGGSSAQYVSLPAGLLNGVTKTTVSAWVKWSPSATKYQWLFGLGADSTKYLYATPYGGAAKLYSGLTTTGPSGESKLVGAGALSATWTHVAVVVDSVAQVETLYVNGAEVARVTTSVSPASLYSSSSSVSGYIGKSFFSADPYFAGTVDDFRIYTTALSASAIQALATS